jgi:predicted Co/Zn/Cd cation transporter (cation efflux family)
MVRAARNAGTEMSLRAFHLLFISLSVILAAFFAAWAVGQYRLEHQIGYAAACVLALASGGVLAIYGTRFQRKTRDL